MRTPFLLQANAIGHVMRIIFGEELYFDVCHSKINIVKSCGQRSQAQAKG